ncbi:MAG TPA: MMPL family transporter [Candidatus Atribacteria bacterium]|nr:MMPL family transporter [Candidatus Atribacteria bacterium]
MQKISQWIVKNAWLILIAVLIVTIFFAFQVVNVKFKDDVTEYLPEDDPEISFYNSLSDKFASFQKKSMIVALEFDDLFIPHNLELLQEIVESIEKLSSVKGVSALTNMPKVVATDFGIEVKEVVETLPQTPEEAKNLRNDLEKDKLIWGKMVTEDGKGTIIAVSFYETVDEEKAVDEVRAVCRPYEGEAQITYFGLPIIMEQTSYDAQRTLKVLAPLAGLLLLLILYWGFRSLQGVILPIFVALLASLWTLGLAALIGESLTIVSATLPVILLAMVTAYGIHFINRYYEERSRIGGDDVTRITLQEVFVPISLSALTTMGGFISLLSADIKPITEFGLYSTLGIFFGFLLATFFLGAFFTVFTPRRLPRHFTREEEANPQDLISRFLLLLTRGVTHHRNLIIAIIIAALVVLTVGIPRIQVETTVEEQIGANHPLTKLLKYFQERFGGTDYNYLYLETQNVKDPFVLREIIRISRFAERYEAFSDPSSIADFICNLNEAVDGWEAIPDTREKVENLWFFAQDNSFIKDRISEDGKATLIEFRARETTSRQLEEEVETLKSFLAQRPQRVTAVPITENGAAQYLAKSVVDDLEIFGLSFSEREAVEKMVLQFIKQPLGDFMTFDEEFAQKVTHDALLEIEDLGLEEEEVKKALLSYYSQPDSSLSSVLETDLGIIEDDALYLADVLDLSMERVARNNKANTLRQEIENLVGQTLDSDFDFVFYQILDEYVFLPQENGDILVSYRLTGTPIIANHINNQLFTQQIESLILAFIIVYLLLLLQLRSIKKSLVAVIPILMTVYTSFGLMGLLGIPLNTATLMVASIAIGVGIDYTIHFTSRWYLELREGSPNPLRTTLVNTGRGIVLNSLSVSGGIYILTLSRIRMLRMFGDLVATVLLISMFYTLMVLPLLLHAAEYGNNKNIERG